MLTPAEASCCTGEYNLLWTSFRRRAIKRNHAVESGDCETSSPPPAGAPSGLRPSVSPARGVPVHQEKQE